LKEFRNQKFLLLTICHLSGSFGEDRFGGLADMATEKKKEE